MKDSSKDLSLGIERTIDDLGRVVIPKEMRNKLNFQKNQKVNIKLFENHIQIERSQLGCCFCGSEENITYYNYVPLCSLCLEEIIKKFSK